MIKFTYPCVVIAAAQLISLNYPHSLILWWVLLCWLSRAVTPNWVGRPSGYVLLQEGALHEQVLLTWLRHHCAIAITASTILQIRSTSTDYLSAKPSTQEKHSFFFNWDTWSQPFMPRHLPELNPGVVAVSSFCETIFTKFKKEVSCLLMSHSIEW